MCGFERNCAYFCRVNLKLKMMDRLFFIIIAFIEYTIKFMLLKHITQ